MVLSFYEYSINGIISDLSLLFWAITGMIVG